jgi:hypothetical protein
MLASFRLRGDLPSRGLTGINLLFCLLCFAGAAFAVEFEHS